MYSYDFARAAIHPSEAVAPNASLSAGLPTQLTKEAARGESEPSKRVRSASRSSQSMPHGSTFQHSNLGRVLFFSAGVRFGGAQISDAGVLALIFPKD